MPFISLVTFLLISIILVSGCLSQQTEVDGIVTLSFSVTHSHGYGTITINGVEYGDGDSVELEPGNYSVVGVAASDSTFLNWKKEGDISFTMPTSSSTFIEIDGDGTLIMVQTERETFRDPTTIPLQELGTSTFEESEIDRLGIYKTMEEPFDFCNGIGAKVVNIAEYETFFVYYLPEGWEDLEEKKVMVLLHDSDECAYSRIQGLYESAEKYSFAIVSLQWGWRPMKNGDYKYLDQDVLYDASIMALRYLEERYDIDEDDVAWNGYGRSGGVSIAQAYYDVEKNGWFSLFMEISGGLDTSVSMVDDLIEGAYGESPIEGKSFYLWCGTADNGGLTCEDMTLDCDLLVGMGAVVDYFDIGQDMDKTYWNNTPESQEHAIELWLNII